MDIDLFGNIDNFLQDSPKLESKNYDEDDPNILNRNSTLSMAIDTEKDSKRKRKPTTTSKSTNIIDCDNEIDLITQKRSREKLKAGKGQKLAVQRFGKIKEKLGNNVKNAEFVDSFDIEAIYSNVRRQQPTKSTRTSTITTRPRRIQNTMDSVDLTEEIPLFSGSKCMSSAGPSTKNTTVADPDSSFSSENYTVTVKIHWYSEMLKIDLRKYQKFSDLCQTLGELNGIDPTTIVLMMDGIIINAATETPDSIGYTISKFISARSAMNIDVSTLTSGSRNADGKTDEPEIKLKIQCANRKKPLFVSIKRSNKMKVLFIKLSEELNIPPNKLRLKFDGEPLDLEATPDDLDIDDDELLDLKIIE